MTASKAADDAFDLLGPNLRRENLERERVGDSFKAQITTLFIRQAARDLHYSYIQISLIKHKPFNNCN